MARPRACYFYPRRRKTQPGARGQGRASPEKRKNRLPNIKALMSNQSSLSGSLSDSNTLLAIPKLQYACESAFIITIPHKEVK